MYGDAGRVPTCVRDCMEGISENEERGRDEVGMRRCESIDGKEVGYAEWIRESEY